MLLLFGFGVVNVFEESYRGCEQYSEDVNRI
jgi:hypothetical protein